MTVKVGFENLPAPIVLHLQDSITAWPIQPHVYHVTSIIRCLRKAWYMHTHPERAEWGVRSLWNIYRGTVFDKKWTSLFEIHQRNYRAKRRGTVITGTLDFVYDDGDGPILYDLKMPASTTAKKIYGAGQGYKRQVQAYLALAHANGELTDIHQARVLMVGSDVVVEDVPEWTDMLEAYLWPRAFVLDAALRVGSPVGLPPAEEGWECGVDPEGVPYCPADLHFRKTCETAKHTRKLEVSVEDSEELPEIEAEREMKELLY